MASLFVGFAADPFVRWMFPEAQVYLAASPDGFDAFATGPQTTGRVAVERRCAVIRALVESGINDRSTTDRQ
jgi:hypothetical protein